MHAYEDWGSRLQGDFIEHIAMLRRIGVEASEVRLPEHLDGLDGLIIPGGESTTIGKLAVAYRPDGAAAPVWRSRKPSGAPAPGRSFSRKMPTASSRCSD